MEACWDVEVVDEVDGSKVAAVVEMVDVGAVVLLVVDRVDVMLESEAEDVDELLALVLSTDEDVVVGVDAVLVD